VIKKRTISSSLTQLYSLRFPYKKQCQNNHYRYVGIVGIGGNVGDVRRRFHHLFTTFQREKRVELIETSLILKNPPFGYTKQDDFLNAIVVLRTSMQPKPFLKYLLHVEKRFGRKRSFANAPRTLDLDMIFFDNRVMNTKELHLPHPHWFKRESVVIPLAGVLG